jgi:hypothetical protein
MRGRGLWLWVFMVRVKVRMQAPATTLTSMRSIDQSAGHEYQRLHASSCARCRDGYMATQDLLHPARYATSRVVMLTYLARACTSHHPLAYYKTRSIVVILLIGSSLTSHLTLSALSESCHLPSSHQKYSTPHHAPPLASIHTTPR